MKATALSDSLNQSKLHFIDIDGVRTRYYEDGAGTPLLLLHGGEYGSMYSLDSWSLNLPALAQRFHVYALDKLGQGFTDGPRNKDYTFEALLAHTLAFMQKVGFSRGCIAGHSRGGFLATCIAMEQPELVEKLIIVDSATASPDQPNFDSGAFYRSLGVTGIRPPVDEPVTE
ncbi:MAG TPA: alpha/beta hydrolase, partial [Dehalococcoidia bacterium]|nr:alpha/beta hydrolase [Dehalococcoidia bacterium]